MNDYNVLFYARKRDMSLVERVVLWLAHHPNSTLAFQFQTKKTFDLIFIMVQFNLSTPPMPFAPPLLFAPIFATFEVAPGPVWLNFPRTWGRGRSDPFFGALLQAAKYYLRQMGLPEDAPPFGWPIAWWLFGEPRLDQTKKIELN